MRATVSYLRKHHTRDDVLGWWEELPQRTREWWRELLLQEGEGWLRWKVDQRCSYSYYDPPEPYGVMPPVHRVACRLRGISVLLHGRKIKSWWHEWDVMIGDERKRLWK